MQEDLSYGDDPAQKLDLYQQGMPVGEPAWFERASDLRPTLLFIHGGAWLYGDKTGSDPFFLPFLERGWHVVNMTYRLGRGTAPAAVDDALCALRWVADNASEYGFDRDRIVIAGGSAGGHLALMAGILGSREGHPCHPGGDFKVAAVISWFGITDVAALNGIWRAPCPTPTTHLPGSVTMRGSSRCPTSSHRSGWPTPMHRRS
jgi:acetyl esterase/lipase